MLRQVLLHLLFLAACLHPLAAIQIVLNYDYDSEGFFDQAGAKEAMRAVADYYEALLHDELAAITPEGSNTWTAYFYHPGNGDLVAINDLAVPANTLIVYVGGYDLGVPLGRGGPGGYWLSGTSSFGEAVVGRGQAGALGVTPTDFGPWGGALTFSTAYDWNFLIDERAGDSTFDFVATALHEMGHLLGVGTSESWEAQIDEADLFHGPNSVASFGAPVPVQEAAAPSESDPNPNHGHWQNDGVCQAPLGYDPDNPLNVLSLTHGSFGAPHAVDQIARMDPSSCPFYSSSILVMTDLDLAGLIDIGWELKPPLQMEIVQLMPGDSDFAWPSTTGSTVYLQRSTDLSAGWTDVGTSVPGDGTVLYLSDSSAPLTQAFYRFSPTSATVTLSATVGNLLQSGNVMEDESDLRVQSYRGPIMVDSCTACRH
ncbi:hypothetical protein [Coraliomargarita parva]|uniref:hypothetical protein n=1 Tax=Coraliomargarita parva TaxID=3014050 RepID=UPI0022B41243|nr:hypothetical protein [Coraliomargarita parva]